MAGVDCRAQECEQRNPVLSVTDGEGADRRQKEEVKQYGSCERCTDRVTQAPCSRQNQHNDEEGQRHGRLVGMKSELVETDYSGEDVGDEQPGPGVSSAER